MRILQEDTEPPYRLLTLYFVCGVVLAALVNVFLPLLRPVATAALAVGVIGSTCFAHYYVKPKSTHRTRLRIRLVGATIIIFGVLSWGSGYPVDLGTDRRLFPLGELLLGCLLAGVVSDLMALLCGGCADLLYPHLRRFASEATCQNCGYNLTGNVSGVCPECGRPIEAET